MHNAQNNVSLYCLQQCTTTPSSSKQNAIPNDFDGLPKKFSVLTVKVVADPITQRIKMFWMTKVLIYTIHLTFWTINLRKQMVRLCLVIWVHCKFTLICRMQTWTFPTLFLTRMFTQYVPLLMRPSFGSSIVLWVVGCFYHFYSLC